MGNNPVVSVGEFALDDGSQILDAIRTGCVDAFVVEERDGHTVYTLQNADLPYSTLVERMQQGAAMLDSAGNIIYCNPSLAALLGTTPEAQAGHRFHEVVAAEDRAAFESLLGGPDGNREGEFRLCRYDQTEVPARLSLTPLSRDNSVLGILVSDLTSEKSYAELASRIQSVQDEERRNIARELHDSVGQLLAALAMNLARLDKEAPSLSLSSSNLLADCGVMVDQVSREIRTISHLLHPPLLDMAGLSSAIRWYVDGFSHRSNIKVDVQVDSDLGRLPAELEICLFRVVQECLTNVYRHSGSEFCSITITRDAQRVTMEVRDTGHGIRNPVDGEVPAGVGLRGMRERLRLVGGTLQIQSSENGTSVTVTIPSAVSA
ncbi:MAG TPA: PAS domain-containing sensor histidine kinase [Dongiaceae bacterium]|nr:PAS domain-containing sensor histidine kinase [Dongiaceae bacterium]